MREQMKRFLERVHKMKLTVHKIKKVKRRGKKNVLVIYKY